MDLSKTYMDVAYAFGRNSRSMISSVGAILVKDGNIISFGYNGMPSGMSNNCENADGTTRKEVLHAESNAIAKCAKSTQSSAGAALYTTLSPCLECAKLIIQAGIIEVICAMRYRDDAGLNLLNKAQIKVTWI